MNVISYVENFLDNLTKHGMELAAAQKVAAHFANRYAGALPAEAMSHGAAKLANLTLFSRSFTIGNLGAMKDAVAGLPRDVQAQIGKSPALKLTQRVSNPTPAPQSLLKTRNCTQYAPGWSVKISAEVSSGSVPLCTTD